MHFWRAFFIFAAVSIAPPVVLGVLSTFVGVIAMMFGFLIAPVLIYAYPALLLMPLRSEAAPWASLLIAVVCCAVFGFFAQRRDTFDQWIIAFTAFAGWWIGWRLICFFAGIHPHLDVRM